MIHVRYECDGDELATEKSNIVIIPRKGEGVVLSDAPGIIVKFKVISVIHLVVADQPHTVVVGMEVL